MIDDKNKGSGREEQDDRLNLAPPAKPFSRLKIIELALCAVAVLIGIVYLNTELIPLGTLLAIYSAFFSAIPILRGVDAKKSGGGFVAFLPAICWGVLAVCVIVATVAYFAV